MLMGKLLAEFGMREGYNVTWMPSYGAEVRGGTAHCMVRMSSGSIASPLISSPSACIIMNAPSLRKFMDKVKKDGLLVINTSMVESIIEKESVRIAGFPFTQLASGLENVKVANMLALGAFMKLKNLFSFKKVRDSLGEVLPLKADLVALNKKALEMGYELPDGR